MPSDPQVVLSQERIVEMARPGASLTFEEMIAHLETRKIAKTYLPERPEIVEELPRTPSGKIQKFQLREIASRLAAET